MGPLIELVKEISSEDAARFVRVYMANIGVNLKKPKSARRIFACTKALAAISKEVELKNARTVTQLLGLILTKVSVQQLRR